MKQTLLSALPPWERLLKSLVWRQLDRVSGQRILDYGSGEGITAAYLGQRNDVLAVEPSEEMLSGRVPGRYEQRRGGLDVLRGLPSSAFDWVICHNVLEYVDDKPEALHGLVRVLRPGGTLSLVKHNRVGRVFQMAVLLDDPDRAHALLDGENGSSAQFGAIRYYEDSDVTRWAPELHLERCLGMRTFWDLQQRQERHGDPAWQERMLALEARVAEIPEYRSAAFFHHLILTKSPQG